MLKESVLLLANNSQNDDRLIEELKGFIFNYSDKEDERTELGDDEDNEENEESNELGDDEDFDNEQELDGVDGD